MKRLFTFVMTMVLGATLALAQTGGGTGGKKDELNPQPLPPGRKAETTKTAKTSKAHKGGKKSKKGSSTTTTTTNPK